MTDKIEEEYHRNPDKCLMQVKDLLEDALRFHKGTINDKQKAVVKEVQALIERGNLNLSDLKRIDHMLYDVGLNTIPGINEEDE